MENQIGTLVDVRSQMEFMGGHPNGAINIPLQEVPARLEEFKNMKQPLVLCCASGNRSGQACQFLQQNGIEAENGGSWINFNVADPQYK